MTGKQRVRVEVDARTGIVIRAPIEMAEQDLINAAIDAHRQARSLLDPNVRQRADQKGRQVLDLRAVGMSWEQIRQEMSKRLGREVDMKQIRDWRRTFRRRVPGSRELWYEASEEAFADELNRRQRGDTSERK
jgi:hypothetical protein